MTIHSCPCRIHSARLVACSRVSIQSVYGQSGSVAARHRTKFVGYCRLRFVVVAHHGVAGSVVASAVGIVDGAGDDIR